MFSVEEKGEITLNKDHFWPLVPKTFSLYSNCTNNEVSSPKAIVQRKRYYVHPNKQGEGGRKHTPQLEFKLPLQWKPNYRKKVRLLEVVPLVVEDFRFGVMIFDLKSNNFTTFSPGVLECFKTVLQQEKGEKEKKFFLTRFTTALCEGMKQVVDNKELLTRKLCNIRYGNFKMEYSTSIMSAYQSRVEIRVPRCVKYTEQGRKIDVSPYDFSSSLLFSTQKTSEPSPSPPPSARTLSRRQRRKKQKNLAK